MQGTRNDGRHPLKNHCFLVTDDLDHARESVGRMWERHRSQLKRGHRYDLRWHQAQFARTTLSYAATASALDIECGPVSDSVKVTVHLAGRLSHRVNGDDALSTRATAVVHAPGDELIMETEPFRLLLLAFDGALVRSALAARFDRSMPDAGWPRSFSLTTPAGTSLRHLLLWTAEQLDHRDSDLVSNRRTAVAVQQTLLSLFLDASDGGWPAGMVIDDTLDERRLRLLEDWIDGHLSDPVTIEDLARVAGVSARAVQATFRRRRQCTPMAFVMRRRLEGVRRALGVAPPSATLTAIAMDHGLFHMGRFAAAYHRLFGERPSETRAREARRMSATVRKTTKTAIADNG